VPTYDVRIVQTDRGAPVSKPVFGYVLAGGGSRRFGRDKALVEFGATPLLLRIAALAEACTAGVGIVANAQKYANLQTAVPIIEDRWPGEGPLGGIITALEHNAATAPGCQWNLLLSCDMPFLTLQWLEFLVKRARDSAASVVLPRSAHGPEPLCACYRTDAATTLKDAFESGIRKVTEALKRVSTEVLDEPVWKRFDSAGRLFWNMNTPEDFAEAQRLWETEQS
jgi:molybdopterin-guanine dinucleotide biosynthesis protein A